MEMKGKPRRIPIRVPFSVASFTLEAHEEPEREYVALTCFVGALVQSTEGVRNQLWTVRAYFHAFAVRMIWIDPSEIEDRYDDSAFSALYDDSSSLAERISRQWCDTGICPDPAFYEIVGDPWMDEVCEGAAREAKHYMLLGHDCYVEVIATSWRWETLKVERDEPWEPKG